MCGECKYFLLKTNHWLRYYYVPGVLLDIKYVLVNTIAVIPACVKFQSLVDSVKEVRETSVPKDQSTA